MLFASDKFVLHYIKSDSGGGVFLSTTDGLLPAIRLFRGRIDPSMNQKVIFTTATFGDFDYTRAFGFHEHVLMPDVMNANRRMIIYTDTFKMDDINYRGRDWNRIVDGAIEYEKKYPGITFLCMKKNVAMWLKYRLEEKGYDINTDYYRSDNMIGTAHEDRRCVCVGAPVMPINTYDGVSDTYNESQKRRVGNNHASFWQAISRFKSPSGSSDTQIYCIGITEEHIRYMIKWGTERRVEINNLVCKGVDVKNAFDEPVVVVPKQKMCLDIVKSKKRVDRTYLMQYLNITTKDLDKLLINPFVAEHVKVVETKTKRKPKKSCIWVE